MPYSQTIRDILNILDLNIIFSENCLSTKKIKGIISRVFEGFLDENPLCCTQCGADKDQIIRWGYTTSTIKMPTISEYLTYLKLKKRRFFCKNCEATFVLDTPIVDRHHSISKNLKRVVAKKLTSKQSMTEIANQVYVSTTTVYRVLKDWYQPIQKYSEPLPNVLCFDEFKSVKNVSGSMSFIMMNGETRELIDILPDRRLPQLEQYFSGYPLDERKKVKYVVMDIYQPYMVLTKRLFPNAEIVLDKFHLVQHIGRAFQKIRIRRMNSLRTKHNGLFYRRLKKYWKLLQKNYENLDFEKNQWRAGFKEHLSEKSLVERLLSYDKEISAAYSVYQNMMQAFRLKNYDLFLTLIEEAISSPEYITVFKTFKKYKREIKNTLKTSYSNGPLECLNNHIKVLKRNAYGLRSFYNFKLRISICFKNTPFKAPNTQTKSKFA